MLTNFLIVEPRALEDSGMIVSPFQQIVIDEAKVARRLIKIEISMFLSTKILWGVELA